MELIEVIDTAVKVGLGALISGVTTYSVTTLNHRADRSKELAKKKVEVLSFAIEKLEIYFNAYSCCYSALTGILQYGTPAGDFPESKLKTYKLKDEELTKARHDRAVAQSRLRLIGLSAAVKEISKISNIENRFREQVIFQKQLPTMEELAAFSKEMNEVKREIYKALSNEFDKTYG